MKMARPGIVATHHWSSRYWRPVAIIAPHSASGGRAPSPRKPSPAAVMMIPAMSSVTRTISDGRQIGMTWPMMMCMAPAPCSRAAAM
jgi:hypothetical protein